MGAAAAAAGGEAAGGSGGGAEAHAAEAAGAGGLQGPELVADAPFGPEDAAATDCSGAMQTAAAAAAAEGVVGAALDASAALMGVQQAAAAVGEGSAATPMDTADITPAAAAAADPATAAAAADGQHLASLDATDPHNPDTPFNQHQQQQSLVGPLTTSLVHPAAAAAALGRSPQGCSGKKRVLLVGNPALPLKGFPTAIAALTAVSAVLPIKIRWVCQVRLMYCGLRGFCKWV